MSMIAVWCGFVGSWVLVAGPMYQGASELSEVEVDMPALRAQAHAIQPPRRISPWWWLLPPVAYVKTKRNQRVWRQQVMASLTRQQRVQFVTYSHKATGWFMVGGGAALLGINATIALVEALGWPSLATIPLVLVAAAAALAFTVRRMQRSQQALHIGDTAD